MLSHRPTLFVLAAMFITAALDVCTKALAVRCLIEGEIHNVTPLIDLSLAFNRGISFSMFPAKDGLSVAMLAIIQAMVTAVVVWWSVRSPSPIQRLALALVAGGALGNLLDRVADGAVTDFLDLHTAGLRWFTFNLADVWISAGTALMILDAAALAAGGGERAEEARH